MKIFKLSWTKILSTVILSSLLIFFYVPFYLQYCQPIPGEFGGGGCGPWQLGGTFQDTLYPIPPTLSAHGNTIPAVNFVFYSFSHIILQGISPSSPPTKIVFYPYSLVLSLVMIVVSYMLSCLLVTNIYKLKKKKKIYPVLLKK